MNAASPLPTVDGLLAATAKVHGLTLATRNTKDVRRTGIPHDIKVYPEAGHSFFNDSSRAHHHAAAADSWTRVLAFFGEHLTPKP